jgi:hypothetical protein
MIPHIQIATEGMFPGTNHNFIARLGWFDVEIIVTPQPQQQSGGGTGWVESGPYTVTVRVRYKDKMWEQSKLVGALQLKSLEKVVAVFKEIRTTAANVTASVNNVIKTTINVLVRRK